jgi:phosphoglycolate phosphatase
MPRRHLPDERVGGLFQLPTETTPPRWTHTPAEDFRASKTDQDRPLRGCQADSAREDKRLKLLIFDCDGTLVDSQHKICAAMHAAYSALRLPVPPRARMLSAVGLSPPEMFAALAEGGEALPVQRLVEAYRAAAACMRASQTEWEPLFPGARETIESLARRADVVLGIATGKSRRGVDAVLGAHGLRDHFATVQTADRAPSKPHPGMVLQAMEEIGATAQDTVVIGDSIYDMAMATAAGALALGVRWGYHPRHALLESGATIVLDEFAALIPALEAAWPAFSASRPRKANAGHA